MHHADFTDEIIDRAVALYGEPVTTRQQREIVREAIRGISRDPKKWQSALEKACGQAVEEWYQSKEAPVAAVEPPPVEAPPVIDPPKPPMPPGVSKTKKGSDQ